MKSNNLLKILWFQVCELLKKHVSTVVDVGFTAQMETDLDRIAHGQADRLAVMQAFYGPFKTTVDQALTAAAAGRQPAARAAGGTSRAGKRGGKSSKRSQAGALPKSEKEGQACPQCGEGTLVVKSGKFGPFLGCSRYALGCQYTENMRRKRKDRRNSKKD